MERRGSGVSGVSGVSGLGWGQVACKDGSLLSWLKKEAQMR